MLYTASRACLQHPDVAAYKANRDLIYKQLQHAVSGISNAAQATATEDSALGQPGGAGELACALNSFDVSIQILFSPCLAIHSSLEECTFSVQSFFVITLLSAKFFGIKRRQNFSSFFVEFIYWQKLNLGNHRQLKISER